MQFVFDTFYIIFIILGVVWWTRIGRKFAVRHLWPSSFWASLPGWVVGLLVILTLLAWVRSALTQMFFVGQP